MLEYIFQPFTSVKEQISHLSHSMCTVTKSLTAESLLCAGLPPPAAIRSWNITSDQRQNYSPIATPHYGDTSRCLGAPQRPALCSCPSKERFLNKLPPLSSPEGEKLYGVDASQL